MQRGAYQDERSITTESSGYPGRLRRKGKGDGAEGIKSWNGEGSRCPSPEDDWT